MPSLADTESAGEESLGRLAEGGPGSTTFSAIFNSFLDNHSEQRDAGGEPRDLQLLLGPPAEAAAQQCRREGSGEDPAGGGPSSPFSAPRAPGGRQRRSGARVGARGLCPPKARGLSRDGKSPRRKKK